MSRQQRRRPIRTRGHSSATGGFIPAEALESRLLMSAAVKLGKSGYSGTLSTDPATRQQQLICDPVEPFQGSTSVQYDASQVTLRPLSFEDPIVEAGPGYDIKDVQIQVRQFNSDTQQYGAPFLIGRGGFTASSLGQYQETGYVQVKFQLQEGGEAGQITPRSVVLDEEGVEGVDPFALNFNLLPPPPPPGPILTLVGGNFAAAAATAPPPAITYKIFAAGDNFINDPNFSPDFLAVNDADHTPIPASQLSPAVVSANDPITVDPTTGAGGPYTITQGDDLALHGNATRGSASSDNIRYQWDIGNDGTIDVEGKDPVVSSAQLQMLGYSAPQTVQIKLLAGGGTSQATALTTLTIQESSGAKLVDDPAQPGKKALAVTGTNGDDVIRFQKAGNGVAVTIKTAGKPLRTFGPFTNTSFDRVFAFGRGGNDDILMFDGGLLGLLFGGGGNGSAVHPAVFFGGAGNDVLVADNGASILDGGDGLDLIYGGNGKDLLVGGKGNDAIGGGNGEDMLIGGNTSYDEGTNDDIRALTNIVNAWNGPGSYESRITRITTATPTAPALLRLSGVNRNVFDDKATDLLVGGDGRDWLIVSRGDLTDLAKNETATMVLP